MDQNDKKNIKMNWNLILLALILVIAVTSIVRLLIWNKGTKSDFDPSTATTDFDVEALDTIIPLDPELMAQKKDDKVTTILCLGNNPFSDETGAKGISAQLAKETGATVYNAAFPGSRISANYSSFNQGYMRDLFNLPYVAQSIANRNFDRLESAASLEEDPKYAQAVKTLKEVDFESLDFILIMYDATDYIEKTPADNPNDPYELSTYTGGLRAAFASLKKENPYTRIIFMSHTFCHALDENGNFLNGGTADLGNGTLSHYLLLAVNVAINESISVIDNFYGTINENNYRDYLTDNIHLNDAGRSLVAKRAAEVINTGQSSMK